MPGHSARGGPRRHFGEASESSYRDNARRPPGPTSGATERPRLPRVADRAEAGAGCEDGPWGAEKAGWPQPLLGRPLGPALSPTSLTSGEGRGGGCKRKSRRRLWWPAEPELWAPSRAGLRAAAQGPWRGRAGGVAGGRSRACGRRQGFQPRGDGERGQGGGGLRSAALSPLGQGPPNARGRDIGAQERAVGTVARSRSFLSPRRGAWSGASSACSQEC